MMEDNIAIFAVDGGTTSGVARGIFSCQADSAWEGLAAGWHESWEVEGEPSRQGWEIMMEYAEWTGYGDSTQPMQARGVVRTIFILEDFVIRLGTGAGSKRELLDPVRVTQACDTLCLTRQGLRWAHPQYVQPSLAMTFATDERLRRHGMWVKGSAHRRDAVRHMCRAYAHQLGFSK